jgi:hypothetical protein
LGPLFRLIYTSMQGHGELCVVHTIAFTLAFTKARAPSNVMTCNSCHYLKYEIIPFCFIQVHFPLHYHFYPLVFKAWTFVLASFVSQKTYTWPHASSHKNHVPKSWVKRFEGDCFYPYKIFVTTSWAALKLRSLKLPTCVWYWVLPSWISFLKNLMAPHSRSQKSCPWANGHVFLLMVVF